jgi:hypothetical protein
MPSLDLLVTPVTSTREPAPVRRRMRRKGKRLKVEQPSLLAPTLRGCLVWMQMKSRGGAGVRRGGCWGSRCVITDAVLLPEGEQAASALADVALRSLLGIVSPVASDAHQS